MMVGMVEVVETLEQKLKRHQDALSACMVEITRLREENARLRSSEADAHSTLRMIYGDDSQPANVRVRAATAALNVETPALQRVPPALELQAEPVEDLATLVHKRRARQKALEPPYEVIDGQVLLKPGNGSSDHS
jgi:FtsZ-binding cell division protein ZapB